MVDILSLLGTGYSVFSTVLSGRHASSQIAELQRLSDAVTRLSEEVYLAPRVLTLRDASSSAPSIVKNITESAKLLEPLHIAFGRTTLLSSALIDSPPRLKDVFNQNPWSVLCDTCPIDYVEWDLHPGMLPIAFEHNGETYVGWQTRGFLRQLDVESKPWSEALGSTGDEITRHNVQLNTITTNAQIVVRRRVSFQWCNVRASLWINNRHATSLHIGQKQTIQVQPGRSSMYVTIDNEARITSSVMTVVLRPGEAAHFEIDVVARGFLGLASEILIIPC